ncbi:signal peptidase I [Clostridium akagii]|uniref:signal peptidase I n=1 Tax=Clostridium akagii TaxID=91623 RepID=UPI00047B1501|nr:signal peptidase I [Clostridium akagii]
MKSKKIIVDYLIPILIAVVLAILINKFLFFKILVPSPSMSPTIKDNDQIIVTRVYNRNNLKRGDIIVFNSKELKMELIKRLIGLPNDSIEVTTNGVVYVNGKKINQSYVVYNGGKSGVYKVPAGHYFFLGDNRINSLDSRYWKNPYIDGSDINGKAKITIYPFNRLGFLK